MFWREMLIFDLLRVILLIFSTHTFFIKCHLNYPKPQLRVYFKIAKLMQTTVYSAIGWMYLIDNTHRELPKHKVKKWNVF